jgi:hypothetical protein
MYLNKKQLNYVSYVTVFIEGKYFILLTFDFFLLCPCTTEQRLAYHSLINPGPDLTKATYSVRRPSALEKEMVVGRISPRNLKACEYIKSTSRWK